MATRHVVMEFVVAVVLATFGRPAASAQDHREPSKPSTSQPARFELRNYYDLGAATDRLKAADPPRAAQLEDAAMIVMTDELWQPYDAGNGASATAQYHASIVQRLSGKTADEVIELAASLRAKDPSLTEKIRLQQRHSTASLVPLVMRLGAFRIDGYVKQHNGARPDFDRYPNWEQFTANTRVSGEVADDGEVKPMYTSPLENPLLDRAKVVTVKTAADLGKSFKDADAGWVFVNDGRWHALLPPRSLGNLYALDEEGSARSASDVSRMCEQLWRSSSPLQQAMRVEREAVAKARAAAKGAIALYKMAHSNREPDFARYSKWEQFTSRISVECEVTPDGACPPLLPGPPINPARDASRVIVFHGDPADMKPIADQTIGWVMLTKSDGSTSLEALDACGCLAYYGRTPASRPGTRPPRATPP